MITNRLASRATRTDNAKRSLHDDACIPTATRHTTALPVARRRPERVGKADPAGATRAPTSGAPLYEPGATRPHVANDCAAGRRLPPARREEPCAVGEPRPFLCRRRAAHAPHHGRSRTPAANAETR